MPRVECCLAAILLLIPMTLAAFGSHTRGGLDGRVIRVTLRNNIIDSQEDVGGYPAHAPTHRPLEVPDEDREGWFLSIWV